MAARAFRLGRTRRTFVLGHGPAASAPDGERPGDDRAHDDLATRRSRIQLSALQAMCRQVFGFRLAMIALAAPLALVTRHRGLRARLVGAAVVVTFMGSYVLFRDWERFGPLLLRHPSLLAVDTLLRLPAAVLRRPRSTLGLRHRLHPAARRPRLRLARRGVLRLPPVAHPPRGATRPDSGRGAEPRQRLHAAAGFCVVTGAVGVTLRNLMLRFGTASQALTETRARLAVDRGRRVRNAPGWPARCTTRSPRPCTASPSPPTASPPRRTALDPAHRQAPGRTGRAARPAGPPPSPANCSPTCAGSRPGHRRRRPRRRTRSPARATSPAAHRHPGRLPPAGDGHAAARPARRRPASCSPSRPRRMENAHRHARRDRRPTSQAGVDGRSPAHQRATTTAAACPPAPRSTTCAAAGHFGLRRHGRAGRRPSARASASARAGGHGHGGPRGTAARRPARRPRGTQPTGAGLACTSPAPQPLETPARSPRHVPIQPGHERRRAMQDDTPHQAHSTSRPPLRIATLHPRSESPAAVGTVPGSGPGADSDRRSGTAARRGRRRQPGRPGRPDRACSPAATTSRSWPRPPTAARPTTGCPTQARTWSCSTSGCPGVDGISALPHLVQVAPVMMLTYSRENEIVHEALRLGAGGYLVHGEFTADQLVRPYGTSRRAGPTSPRRRQRAAGHVRAGGAATAYRKAGAGHCHGDESATASPSRQTPPRTHGSPARLVAVPQSASQLQPVWDSLRRIGDPAAATPNGSSSD